MSAVGSITTTTLDCGTHVTKYTLAWTSSAGGAVSGIPVNICRGRIWQVKFVPGTGGVQPTNAYTATLIDPDGLDLLFGAASGSAGLSNAAPSMVQPSASSAGVAAVFQEGEAVTLTIAGAGNAKSGTVEIYVKDGWS